MSAKTAQIIPFPAQRFADKSPREQELEMLALFFRIRRGIHIQPEQIEVLREMTRVIEFHTGLR